MSVTPITDQPLGSAKGGYDPLGGHNPEARGFAPQQGFAHNDVPQGLEVLSSAHEIHIRQIREVVECKWGSGGTEKIILDF